MTTTMIMLIAGLLTFGGHCQTDGDLPCEGHCGPYPPGVPYEPSVEEVER